MKNKQKQNQNQNNDQNTEASISEEDVVVTVLFAEEEQCRHVADLFVEWVIDSTASYHVTPKRELFTSYKVGNFGRVKMSNESLADIVGIGDICLQTDVGCTLTLKNVRHVPDMRPNLLSTHAFNDAGYKIYFSNEDRN